MSNFEGKKVAIIGAGLVGSLLGIYLRKHGFSVDFYESRPDPRHVEEVGRSINLIMTSRGIHALTNLSEELAEKVMSITSKVQGRALHMKDGSIKFQSYGPSSSFCNFSVSRWKLNKVLMNAAEECGCKFSFSHTLSHIDILNTKLYFKCGDTTSNVYDEKVVSVSHIFGADGGGLRSGCRESLKKFIGEIAEDIYQPLNYIYKELTLSSNINTDNNSHKLDPNYLHIWPRGSHFLMGLPNQNGSFTMTLYIPNSISDTMRPNKSKDSKSNNSSNEYQQNIDLFFHDNYFDVISLIPDYQSQYTSHPSGSLGTIYCSPWVYKDKIALIGDSCHAITPFFGQGCNSGFEDVTVINELLMKQKDSMNSNNNNNDYDWELLFAEYYELRKPNADAIAQMALDNFTEMMEKTADEKFLLQKEIELELSKRFSCYVSRYALITHSLLPYRLCQLIGLIQDDILFQLSAAIERVDQLDMILADRLLTEKLLPFYAENGISIDALHYSTKYYDAV